MDQLKRAFKGVYIPAEIYLNEELSWIEKIALIEVTSLDGEEGCFATNEHFASHLQISKDRAGKIINKLVNLGYLTREIFYKEGTKQIEKRVLHSTIGYSRKQLEGIGKNNYTPIVENDQDNNTINNNKINNNKKEKETNLNKLIKEYTDNEELREALKDFIKMRKAIKKPLTDRALKGILNKLDKLSNNTQIKIEILEQSIEKCWNGVFPLKENKNNSTNNISQSNKFIQQPTNNTPQNNKFTPHYKVPGENKVGVRVNETFKQYDPDELERLLRESQKGKW